VKTSVGGTEPGAVLLKLVEVLQDGEWHNLEDVHREVGKVIAPGVALRRNERNRRSLQRRHESPEGERTRPISTERAIQAGKRSIVTDALAQHSERSYFQRTPARFPKDPDRLVRMVKMPPAVAQYRALQAAGRLFLADEVVDVMMTSDHPRVVLDSLSREQVQRVAVRLVERLKDEIRGELRDVAPAAPEEAPVAPPA
jgi:hypothetical protein